MHKLGGIAAIILLLSCGPAAGDTPTYAVTFGARLVPGTAVARAFIEVGQTEQRLEQLRLRAPGSRYSRFVADGPLQRDGDRVFWNPPADGGRLSYDVRVDNRRNDKGFDALVADDHALFRGEDLFPPAAISQMDGAESVSRLVMELPEGWRLLTAWPRDDDGGWQVRNPNRKFDRPTGWLAAGRLGIRREQVAGIQVAVGGPPGRGVQRVSMLAMMRWTLPSLAALIPGDPPERLVVLSAGDPMWRGGLSGPNSLFIHAERPLLSEDGTSTLLHELVHVLLPVAAAADHDWIDEGLAEYLTLRLLRDTDTISARRYARSIERFRRRSVGQSLEGTTSSGARTARAVVLFHDLDAELLAASNGERGMPALASALAAMPGPIDLATLVEAARDVGGPRQYASLAAADDARQ